MKTVQDILANKGRALWSITPDALVLDAIRMMAEKHVGALAVMEHNNPERLVGIVSERDYARKVILQNRSSSEITVREIMSSPVICARTDHSVGECMALMTDKRIRHLPVQEHARVIGMISIGDLVKATLAEQQFIIEQLETYIRA